MMGMVPAYRAHLMMLLVLASSCSRGTPSETAAVAAPTAAVATLDPEQVDCMALTLYHEAKGESDEGMIAIGKVIMNRVESARFPDDVCEVIRQGGESRPCQFSWYCDGRSDRPREMQGYVRASAIARQVLADEALEDPTDGATYYHATWMRPYWANRFTQTAVIDRHAFYRDDG